MTRRGRGFARSEAVGECRQERLPPLCNSLLEHEQRHPVAGRVLLGDRVPAKVLNGDSGLGAHGLEPNVYLGRLVGRERRLPPAEREAPRWVPHPNRADLEDIAVVVPLDQAPDRAGLA